MKIVAGFAVVAAVSAASAQVLRFEGYAQPGSLINVSPGTPYTESGFLFMPLTGSSAVFDANGPTDMPGNSDSSFFGWAEANVITLTRTAGGPFDLQSVLLGPSTIASGPATVTVTGYYSAGGSVVQSFPNLTTATLGIMGWTGLSRVEFASTDDAGMDNVAVGAAPCYANCDGSTAPPILNVNDFVCFQMLYAQGSTAANCDGSTAAPILNVSDFICFQTRYAAGCP